MKQIDINSTLLQRLKTDYRDAEGQVKFTNGLDYLEAMVKLFAVINIAVVKKIDTEVYQNIFLNNFKITPSLGDFKSLATHPFTKANKNVLITKNSFYISLYDIFTSKDLDLRLDMADDIIEGNIKEQENKKRITTLRDLFDIYVVNFRNKLKGHGASFSIQDKEQSQIILDNLDSIINAIESKLQTLLKDPQLAFFVEVNEETSEEHDALKVFVKYDEIEYELSPLLIYLECHKFSCKDDHKVKLFFYNDGKASKSYYIDYSYNHYYYFSSNNQVDSTLNEIITYQKGLNAHNTSDNLRQSNLLSVFVGREKELKTSKVHILENIASNTASAITIKGKPGIGKSAFISRLQVELKEKSEVLQSYIFYVRKSEMSDDEHKYFYNKFVSYLDSINISIPKVENDDQLTPKERLEHVFETLDTVLKEPLLLVIDGLDEFANPVSFLQNFPMQNIPNKLHLVFSTRGYPNILEELQTKLFYSDFNLLNKDQYLSESISITLGKLSAYEVETLVEEVLTKDVQRGTQIYKTIQSEIYEKSEGLPLYINYISNKLVEFDLESSNIANDILSYAKELPQGLDDFYFQSFNKLKTISSEILYTLYFSHKHIGFDSFYYLITGLNGFIDKKEFQMHYFNEIEIFLAQDIENKYGFYHLSVKEAIKSYFMQEGNLKAIVEIDYDTFSNNVSVSSYQEAQYKETFDTYYYLKKESDLFELLKKIYIFLTDKQNEEKLSELYKDNYLTYFYKYICFSNYHEVVSFQEMLQKEYRTFENVTLSDNIIKLIQKFFETYESSAKEDITEIKYAHEFALLTCDYDRILLYEKDNEDVFFIKFIDLIWNLDSSNNQKLFKELKPVWSKMYGDTFKLTLLYSKKLRSYPEYMMEVIDSFKNDKTKLESIASILEKTDDQKILAEALEITSRFEEDSDKSKLLASILEKTDDQKLLEKALEITSKFEEDSDKSKLLVSILEKTENKKLLDNALEVVSRFKDDSDKTESLATILVKAEDQKVLTKALKIANTIKDDYEKTLAFLHFGLKMDNQMVLKNALDIANAIEDDCTKSQALSYIGKMTDDKQVLEKALEIANVIKDDYQKLNALIYIGATIDDQEILENALDIAGEKQEAYGKFSILKYFVSNINTEDENLLEKALDFTLTLETYHITKALEFIVKKIGNQKVLVKALEVVSVIEDNDDKSNILASIVEKIEDQKVLEKALDVVCRFDDDNYKSNILTSIVEKVEDQKVLEKALKVVDVIENDRDKLNILAYIVEIIEDQNLLEKALEVASRFEDDNDKSYIFALIAFRMDDIDKALEFVEAMKTYSANKSKALEFIIEKTEDLKVVDKALEITSSFSDHLEDKMTVLISIVEKTEDKSLLEKALEVTDTLDYEIHKSKVLFVIGLKLNDHKLIKKATETIVSMSNIIIKRLAFRYILEKIEDQKILEIVLEVASTIENDGIKSSVLYSITEKIEDKKLLEKSLEVASTIEKKSSVLNSITKKIEDKNLLAKALTLSSSIEKNNRKFKALAYMAIKMEDIEKAFEIADAIEYSSDKIQVFTSIVEKIEDQKILVKALEFIMRIKEDSFKSKALVSVIKKAKDINLIEKVMEIASSFEYYTDKLEVLFSIAEKAEDQQILEKAIKFTDENLMFRVGDWRIAEALTFIVLKMDDNKVLAKVLDYVIECGYEDSSFKSLASIVRKVEDQKILVNALEFTIRIKEDSFKSKALECITEKIEDQNLLEKALEVASTIENNGIKSSVLYSITEKIEDKNLLEKVLEVNSTIENDYSKKIVLLSIVKKAEDQKVLEKVLDITSKMEKDSDKLLLLVFIGIKLNDQKVLAKALESLNVIEDDFDKSLVLAYMGSKMCDQNLLAKALEIVDAIEEDFAQVMALLSIVDETKDQNLLEKALEIISTMEYDDYLGGKLGSIEDITKRIGDQNLLEKVLEVASTIENDSIKLEALEYIIRKTVDKNLLEKALEITNSSEYCTAKIEVLLSIVKKTEDQQILAKALEITGTIQNDSDKSKVLVSIVKKTEDQRILSKALEVTSTIQNDSGKSKVLVSIVKKTEDQQILAKALEITGTIQIDSRKSKTLELIIEKTRDQYLLEKVLETVLTMKNYIEREKLLIYLKKKSSALSRINNYLYKFNSALNFHISESLEYVMLYNDEAILRYYGILDDKDNQQNDLDFIIKELHDIKLQRDRAEESEDEDLYEKLSEEAESIKVTILENERILNDMLQRYDLKKLAFKKKDILETV